MHSLFCITSSKLPYTTLCYIASRFILPWNLSARLYYAAASRGCSLAISRLNFVVNDYLHYFTNIVYFHNYSQLSIRQTSRKSRRLGVVPSSLQCCKADISLKRTLMSVPVVPFLEGLTYCLDFSHRRPLPVSDHFVVHQGWSLTRELTVYSTLYSLSVNVFPLAKSLQLILEISATYSLFRSRFLGRHATLLPSDYPKNTCDYCDS